jgi:hypothetical protein
MSRLEVASDFLNRGRVLPPRNASRTLRQPASGHRKSVRVPAAGNVPLGTRTCDKDERSLEFANSSCVPGAQGLGGSNATELRKAHSVQFGGPGGFGRRFRG